MEQQQPSSHTSQANKVQKKIMVWNNEKDELLCREVLLLEPYQFKVRSRERGNVWKNIADALNRISTENIYFRVDARAVRERCALLINRQIEKEKSEIKQSGISPEETPLDEAIKSIIDRMRECEEEQENQNKENSQKEKKAAEDIRLKAMESLAETKARKRGSLSEDDESPKSSKKRRSSGSDTLQYLREKAESDKELRRQELELQREEVAMRYAQFQHAQQQSQQMMAIMLQLLQNKN